MTRTAKVWLIAAGVLLLYCIVAWFIGSLLALEGQRLWLLRGGLWLLGIVAAGGTVWFLLRRGASAPKPLREEDDIDATVKAARAQLSRARLPGTASLPLVLMMGAEGSAKTTAVMQSGLEPELLAGELNRGDGLAPTNAVNVWYTQGTIFLEAGGPVLAEPARWTRLLGYLHPRRLAAALGRGTVAPRVAIVCVSCDELTKPGRSDALLALGRTIRSRLAEASRQLGIRLPVYVLFTKADRIPFFEEYVRNFSREEVREVLGATLPVETGPSGLYADRQARQLIDAFERLFLSLAEKRLQFLPREHELDRKLGAYEFPREFRKLAPGAVQFLVEVCKPSELQVSPFLRGFYFSGVRPVTVSGDVGGAAGGAIAQPQREPAYVGATNVFNAERPAAPAPVASVAASPSRHAQRVPQWVFATRFFSDVILGDQAAMGVTRGGARVDALRRMLIGAAAAAGVVLAIGFTVSYVNNRRLERGATDAMRRAAQVVAMPAGPELASLDALQRLDSLRYYAATLGAYERGRVPLGLRWGLYQGDALYPGVRRTYFAVFQQLLFATTRASLLSSLRAVTDVPRASSEYDTTYNLLKAHLMTTDFHAKSDSAFLTPLLRQQWQRGRPLDPLRGPLAERQFDFYADELRIANPYPGPSDGQAVVHARAALHQGSAKERIYKFMLDSAARDNKAIQFNRRFPGSATVLVDAYEVPGAFTRGGWATMQGPPNHPEQGLLYHPDRYVRGDWVTDDSVGAPVDPTSIDSLRTQLRTQYLADYVRHWRDFLLHARLVGYNSVADAAAKLAKLSGAESPLLALSALAARNTVVDTGMLAKVFKPVQVVTPPGDSTKLKSQSNAPYLTALLGLQSALDALAQPPGGARDAAATQARQSATDAKRVAKEIALEFGTVDPKIGEIVERLLLEPITNADGLLSHFGVGEVNGAGRPVCADVRALVAKYPFNSASPVEARVDEVNPVFQPGTGKLWAFYTQHLQNVVEREGSVFKPKSGGTMTVSSPFLDFMNRAIAWSDALYKPGSTNPSLKFSVKTFSTSGVASVTLVIDGQTVPFTQTSVAQQDSVIWRATSTSEARLSARLSVQNGGADTTLSGFKGPWSVFHLFQAGNSVLTGNVQRVTWGQKPGGQVTTLSNRTPVHVTLDVDLGAASLVLKPNFFAGFTCGGDIVK